MHRRGLVLTGEKIMEGDMGGGGSSPQTGADGAPVSTDGTARDFDNMLNAYMGKKKHKSKLGYSPWVKMGARK